ncbi:hypothetical protein ACSDQ9_10320 [Aestuariimicrobium soli]|uniref:hypothetical protein n=1 Tax=Aestuariimicrobium soli TaxID=2035834 RepID=UPI003EBD61D3
MVAWRPDERLQGLVDTELAAALDEAAAGHRAALIGAWLRQLGLVASRVTPVRVVTRFGEGVARLQFADHSAILVDAHGPQTRVGELAMAVARQRPVTVVAARCDDDGVVARFEWPGHTLDVRVLGIDQAP